METNDILNKNKILEENEKLKKEIVEIKEHNVENKMPIKRTYQDVVKCFQDEKCILLTTEEEFKFIGRMPKYKYIASCNHTHFVNFHVFLNRKTGTICPNCIIIRNAKRKKDNMADDKIKYIKQELNCIDYFINITKEHFLMKKAFDGCKADIIMKPINCDKDEWVGIQVKTCKKALRDYGFHLESDYKNNLILCICDSNKKMWLVPYNIVSQQLKITIGISKSKYDKYELTNENVFEKLIESYNSFEKESFEKLDTPLNIYQQREKEYRIFREEKIDFIHFENNGMEGIVYDFKIGDNKIQEKVGGMVKDRKNNFHFTLVKNNGNIDNRRNQIQYEKGDNDFYWLNCDNKKHFYLVPEEVMIEEGYIGNTNKLKKILKVNPLSNKVSSWITPYLFDYDNIDKYLLLQLLGLVLT